MSTSVAKVGFHFKVSNVNEVAIYFSILLLIDIIPANIFDVHAV